MKKLLTLTFCFAIMTTFAQKDKKWVKIFDGKTTKGWHLYQKPTVEGWHAMNGELMTPGKSGDLVTDKDYENFEFSFEFKANPKGNSGVIYKVIESTDPNIHTYMSGPEYQIIDDKNYPADLKDTQKTGANYDMQPPNDFTIVKPAGEWNKGKIIVNKNHVEHWLNGKKVVEYEYDGDKWKEQLAKSKFKTWEYAKPHAKGKIALQDHSDPVSFRNLMIREL